MEKHKNIPKLRFPEFQDAWVDKQLNSIATKIGDGIHGTPKYDEDGEYFFINGNNLVDGHIYITENTKRIDYEEFRIHRRDLNERTILLSINGTIGNLSYYNGEAVILGKSAAYINIDNLYDLTFSYYSLMTNKVQNYFDSELTGTTIKNLSLKTIRSTKLFIPTLPEQQKIASCFIAIDQKISQLKRKKTLLEQYKKGVMQKIFSQEIRFKDDNGHEFPKWEKKKLGEVAEVIMGQSPDSNSYNTEGIGRPLIQGNADIKNRMSNPRNWTAITTKECYVGDLLMTVRAPVGAIAKSMHNACIGRGVCAIRNKSQCNIEFLYQFFLGYELRWANIEQGSTFTAVSGADIKKLKISVPNLIEQTKIANFLSAIDDKINRTQKQIEKAEVWKKGLMHQMFV